MDFCLLYEFLKRKLFNFKAGGGGGSSSSFYRIVLIGCLIVLALVASACVFRLLENPTGTRTREYLQYTYPNKKLPMLTETTQRLAKYAHIVNLYICSFRTAINLPHALIFTTVIIINRSKFRAGFTTAYTIQKEQ